MRRRGEEGKRQEYVPMLVWQEQRWVGHYCSARVVFFEYHGTLLTNDLLRHLLAPASSSSCCSSLSSSSYLVAEVRRGDREDQLGALQSGGGLEERHDLFQVRCILGGRAALPRRAGLGAGRGRRAIGVRVCARVERVMEAPVE